MRVFKVLIACGSGAVTSTIVETRLKEIASENGFDVSTRRCAASALVSSLEDAELVVTSYKYLGGPIGVPIISGTPLVMGINEEQFEKEFVEALNSLEDK